MAVGTVNSNYRHFFPCKVTPTCHILCLLSYLWSMASHECWCIQIQYIWVRSAMGGAVTQCLMKACIISSGSGKMMVEFFSAAMVLRVWR